MNTEDFPYNGNRENKRIISLGWSRGSRTLKVKISKDYFCLYTNGLNHIDFIKPYSFFLQELKTDFLNLSFIFNWLFGSIIGYLNRCIQKVGPNRNPDHNRLDKFHVELISRKVEIYSIDKLNLNHKKVEFL